MSLRSLAAVAGLVLTGLAVLAPAGAGAEEPALRVSVIYAGHGTYQMSETGTINRQTTAEFGWSDLFPPLGAIELLGPEASGPGVGAGNSNGMGGFLVEGDTAVIPAGEFSASESGHGNCEARGNLEARPPQLSITPELGASGLDADWTFEIKEAGRFVDAAPASGDGDDCGLVGHTSVDDVFWDNWVEVTQSGGDQIDRSFRLTSQELHGSGEIILPVSYDQTVNAEGWGGGDFCSAQSRPCTVSFEWNGTVTLKIAAVGGEEAAPPGPGSGPGPGPTPSHPSKSADGQAGHGCVVPHLKGKKLGKARKLLAGAGCKLGKVKRRKAGRSHRGRVMSQSKPPGRHLAARTAIRVVVGK